MNGQLEAMLRQALPVSFDASGRAEPPTAQAAAGSRSPAPGHAEGVDGGPARASGSEPPDSPIGSPGSFDFDLGDEDEDEAGAAAAKSPSMDSDGAGGSDHEAGGATGGLARRQVGPDSHAVLDVTS
jgi:hypothetical protein